MTAPRDMSAATPALTKILRFRCALVLYSRASTKGDKAAAQELTDALCGCCMDCGHPASCYTAKRCKISGAPMPLEKLIVMHGPMRKLLAGDEDE